ncbi:chemotaxis protein CheB [Dolichospermum sp. UHCC 0259]|uniref:chemotaxis protein CheB n=1 Tax=Dolichospermum sp. UHCC 0259 TaxID=2590010 RepID=UPI0014480E53
MKIDNCFLVGVGASAGGLQAVEEFFDNMPADSGAAFVVVQHLSPDFKSVMKELLERRTRMTVKRVKEGMKVEPNIVYLNTPGHNLIIENGIIKLIEQNKFPSQQPNFPINIFFESLAKDRGDRSLGVVLSGTGNDGTWGLQSISEAGGLTFVQSPATAEFDGMPQSAIPTERFAIASGIVDQVLPPQEIARRVYEIIQMQRSGATSSEPLLQKLESDKLQKIIYILNEYEKLDFSHYKPNTLSRRIYRRFSMSEYTHIEEYINYLKTSSAERVLLRDYLMIGVTRFFRDPQAWEYLENAVLPQLINELENGQKLRIWVTACASGEEAYSMAILIDELVTKLGKNISFKIFATDIDHTALAKASEGIYPESIAIDVSPERLEKYFIFSDGNFYVSRTLRESMIFAPHNLAKNIGFTRMHLISCRNVLIYMQPILQQHIMRMLHFSLVYKGVLFLGAAETPGDLLEEFSPLEERYKIYQKRRNVRLPLFTENLEYNTIPVSRSPVSRRSSKQVDTLFVKALSGFAQQRGCTCLLFNDELTLFYMATDAAQIMEMPQSSMNQISDLLPNELDLPITTALHRAKRELKPVLYDGIHFHQRDVIRYVNLEVTYYPGDTRVDDFFMVIIENEVQPIQPRPVEKFEQEVEASQRIFNLEYELEQAHENLHSTIESLEVINEEQQATNEELVASNEELQSTNEELHSLNEELYSLNAEYQIKIGQLIELNNDIDNLLRSSEIGVIFLDCNLRVRKFTLAATLAVNLLPTDVHRPIQHLNYNFHCPNLLELLQQVLDTEQPIEQEVSLTPNHQNFLMRIYPYLQDKNQVDGLVINFINIDEMKRVQQELQARTDELELIYSSSEVGFALIDEDYRFLRINEVMAEMNGISAADHLDKTLQDVLPDLTPTLEPLFQQILETQEVVRNIPIQGTTPAQPNVLRDWIVSYLPIQLANGRRAINAVVVEVTELKKTQAVLRQTEERLRVLMQSSHTIVFSCEPENDYRATFISDNVQQVLGYSPQEFLEQPNFWVDHLHPDDLDRVVAGLTQLTESEIYSHEYRLLHANGTYRWFFAQLRLNRDSEGVIDDCVGYLVDISDRKRAEEATQQRAEQEHLQLTITKRIRESLELESIFNTACQEIRQVLDADRVGIFKFYPESNFDDGEFIAESLVAGYPSAMSIRIHDHCFGEQYAASYRQGILQVVDDIDNAGLTDCHRDVLAQFQIRANLVVPLLQGENLWGLLCIHQCSQPRCWQEFEVALVKQIANQLAIAIQQANLYHQAQSELVIRQQAEAKIAQQLREQQALAKITEQTRHRQSLSLEEILQIVTQEVQEIIQCDRVIIFRLFPDGRSQIVEESVFPEFTKFKNRQWEDEVWDDEILNTYWQGQPRIVPDVMDDIWTDCLREYSQEGNIKSKIVAPILQEAHGLENHRWQNPHTYNKLWGIVVVHACSSQRVWQEAEAQFLQQVANQLAIAIQQVNLFQQLQQELSQRQKTQEQLTQRNQELDISNQELARATRLKDEFLANMSHELRTPLNAILGMTEGLQDEIFGIISDKQIKALHTVERSANHLLALINDILDVAKIESGKIELNYSTVAISHLCESSLVFIKQQALEKRIQVIQHIPTGLPDISVDERRIRQVLINILNNGVKFTPPGGRITLEVSYASPSQPGGENSTLDSDIKNALQFAIADTGIGISAENMQKLFQPFTQIDSALNRQHEGTGLEGV